MRALDEMRIEHTIKTGTKGGFQADGGLGGLALFGVGHAGAFVRPVNSVEAMGPDQCSAIQVIFGPTVSTRWRR